jgi:CRISPR system Cascade subunit CasE
MTLFMLQAPLDMKAFNRWAAARGLVGADVFDEGLALHRLLSALFGKGALQPFRLFAPRRSGPGTLYGYAALDHIALARLAAEVGTPDDLAVLPPAALRSKPMPERFSAGRRLGFDLRARPVRRALHDITDATASGTIAVRRGREADAFLIDVLARPRPDDAPGAADGLVRRGEHYGAWLGERLAPAATLETVRLAAFRRQRSQRGTVRVEGPDATLQGTLVVHDPAAFDRLLAGGVGRHKAYGYGMLMLRPPDRPAPAG